MVNETNGLSKKRELTCQRIIDSLKETHGLLSMAARKAGVSYTTVKRYAAEFPSVKEAVQDAKESMIEFAEAKLFQKINEGDTASILFYLKTQGKHKGYIEKQESTVDITSGGEPLKSRDIPVSVIDEAMEILYRSGSSTPAPGDNRETQG